MKIRAGLIGMGGKGLLLSFGAVFWRDPSSDYNDKPTKYEGVDIHLALWWVRLSRPTREQGKGKTE